MHRPSGPGEPPAAVQQLAATVRRRTGFTERRPAGRARQAMPAARHEDHHYMITGQEVAHSVTDALHHTCRFVTECDRYGPRTVAVDDRQVGMAEPGCDDPNQDLRWARRRQFEILDHERARCGVGSGETNTPQYRSLCRSYRHGVVLAGARRRAMRTADRLTRFQALSAPLPVEGLRTMQTHKRPFAMRGPPAGFD